MELLISENQKNLKLLKNQFFVNSQKYANRLQIFVFGIGQTNES